MWTVIRGMIELTYPRLCADCVHLFLAPHAVTTCGQVEMGSDGRIYTVETGKHYKSGLFLLGSQWLNSFWCTLGG